MRNYRLDFPIYRNNSDLVYLDYAATTFMPDEVLLAWMDYHQSIGVSCYRGDGILSSLAQKYYDKSKEMLLNFFNANNDYSIAFGKNATECLNLLAYSIGKTINAGDIILLSPYEHHSSVLPWKYVANKTGACVLQLPLLKNDTVDYAFFEKIDASRIKVISSILESNINSFRIDTNWLRKYAKKTSAFTILDVSQAVSHTKLDFQDLGFDAYVMSAHKMYGPKNIGGVFIKRKLIEKMSPFLLGGGMVWSALGEKPQWHSGSRKFEAGTFDVGLLYAWSKACAYIQRIGFDYIEYNNKRIFDYLIQRLSFNGIDYLSSGNPSSSICSFSVDGLHPHDIANLMQQNNIEIRTGHMCAQDALNNLGITSLCRLSWGIGSCKKDIDLFFDVLERNIRYCENKNSMGSRNSKEI